MIIDVILLLVMALGTFIGYKRGFVKVIIKLGITILAVVLSFLFQSSVANFISDTIGLKPTITVAVQNRLVSFTNQEETNMAKKEINIPILSKTIKEINSATNDKKEEQLNKWAEKIAKFIIKGLSFMAIFIVVAITMGIVSLILDMIVKLPVLSTLNGALGGVSEFVFILFIICIVLAVISFLSPLGILNDIEEYINESCITKWLYENNIIVNIIGRDLL